MNFCFTLRSFRPHMRLIPINHLGNERYNHLPRLLFDLFIGRMKCSSLLAVRFFDVFALLSESPAAPSRYGTWRLICPVMRDALHSDPYWQGESSSSSLSCPREELLSGLVVCKMELRPEWGWGIWPVDLLKEGEFGRGFCVLFPV